MTETKSDFCTMERPAPPQGAAAAPLFASLLTGLGFNIPVRLRRGQTVTMSGPAGDLIYVVLSGVITVHASSPHFRETHIGLYFPGEIIGAGNQSVFPDLRLEAPVSAELLKMRRSVLTRLLGENPPLLAAYDAECNRQLARQTLHSVVLSTLDAAQRVASLLIEVALASGAPPGNGMPIEVPLSRVDLAHYLALNPDTVSRLMSRLREQGILTALGRNRYAVKDWPALLAQSPISRALAGVHGA